MSETTTETTARDTTATAPSGTTVSISAPVANGETVHPVRAAVHEHLVAKIAHALENIPEEIEHDFSASVDWVKSHL